MTIGVIGAGSMGGGIAQVAASSGCKVLVYDASSTAIEQCRVKLKKVLERLVAKERVSKDQASEIQANIAYIDQKAEFAFCDLVIEAIVEDLDIKKQIFREIEDIVERNCIIASNTSSLSITALASALKRPQRFLGIHFFNPAPVMKLVEIIPAIQSGSQTIQKARAIIDNWGKLTVLVKDTPGFIVNKVARPFYGEALRMYEEGIADFTTIDWAMTELGNFRMGPFTLMDFIGHDVNYAVTETVFKAFYYNGRYTPSFTQKRMVEAGFYGRKSGRGFYSYIENAVGSEPLKDDDLGRYILDRIVIMLINEAADTLQYAIASKEDIDLAMTKGVNYPKGPLQWADEIGIPECVRRMDDLFEEYREERYRCSSLLRKMAKTGNNFFG